MKDCPTLDKMFTQYRTIASDFEEHLGQGLGVSCPLCIEIWIVAVYCEEEDLKWKKKNMFYNLYIEKTVNHLLSKTHIKMKCII